MYRLISIATILVILAFPATCFAGEYLGTLNNHAHDPNSINNPHGAGSEYKTNGVNNPYSEYGSEYSNKSANNPYATNAPKIYDSEGNYRGRLSNNPYDPESISNPYGKYGNPYSPDSIHNPYGKGSPDNPYGPELKVYGQ